MQKSEATRFSTTLISNELKKKTKLCRKYKKSALLSYELKKRQELALEAKSVQLCHELKKMASLHMKCFLCFFEGFLFFSFSI